MFVADSQSAKASSPTTNALLGHVLLVDDDAGIGRALSLYLSHRNLDVQVTSSATQCLEAFKPSPRLCIVTDVRLPDMTGFALLDELAQQGHEPPAIVITGHGPPAHHFHHRQKPIQQILLKPFEPDDLLKAIRQALLDQA